MCGPNIMILAHGPSTAMLTFAGLAIMTVVLGAIAVIASVWRSRLGVRVGIVALICSSLASATQCFSIWPRRDDSADAVSPDAGIGEFLFLSGPLVIFAILCSVIAMQRARLSPSAQVGACVCCGYSLRGLLSARCPECGTPFDCVGDLRTKAGRPSSSDAQDRDDQQSKQS